MTLLPQLIDVLVYVALARAEAHWFSAVWPFIYDIYAAAVAVGLMAGGSLLVPDFTRLMRSAMARTDRISHRHCGRCWSPTCCSDCPVALDVPLIPQASPTTVPCSCASGCW